MFKGCSFNGFPKEVSPSSRNVKGDSPMSRWETNFGWLWPKLLPYGIIGTYILSGWGK